MKVIAICGSPRRGGNTEQLLETALEVVRARGIDTELIPLAGKTILPCNACMECGVSPRCTRGDDFDPVYQAMLDADGIMIGSPVYYGSATPELMALLGRAGYASRMHGLFARKVGGPVVVAQRAGQDMVLSQLLMWYMINGFIVPGGANWNIAFGGEKGAVRGDATGVRTAHAFGGDIAWLLGKIHQQAPGEHA